MRGHARSQNWAHPTRPNDGHPARSAASPKHAVSGPRVKKKTFNQTADLTGQNLLAVPARPQPPPNRFPACDALPASYRLTPALQRWNAARCPGNGRTEHRSDARRKHAEGRQPAKIYNQSASKLSWPDPPTPARLSRAARLQVRLVGPAPLPSGMNSPPRPRPRKGRGRPGIRASAGPCRSFIHKVGRRPGTGPLAGARASVCFARGG